MVTADGARREVDAVREPDLFWAVRAGKSNFGIVTEVEFRLVPLTHVFGATVYFDAASLDQVIRCYASWTRDLPDEVTSSVAVLRLPGLPAVAEQLRGRTVAHLRFVSCFEGDEREERGHRLLEAMLATGTILHAVVGIMAYADLDHIHDDPVDPSPIWERIGQLAELTDDFIDRLIACVGHEVAWPLAMVEIRHLGGALARVPKPPSAVAGWDGAYSILFLGLQVPGAEEEVARCGSEIVGQLTAHLTGRSVVNWLGGATSPEDVREAWDLPTCMRLVTLKSEVDPGNVFRFGHPLVSAAHNGAAFGTR